jgi:hypothetical protein
MLFPGLQAEQLLARAAEHTEADTGDSDASVFKCDLLLFAYHPGCVVGYWTRSLELVNSHFGSEGDVRSLSDALHNRGMGFMLDTGGW